MPHDSKTTTETGLIAWLKSGLTASTIITIVTLATGFTAGYAREQQRIDDMDRRVAILEQQAARKTDMDTKDHAVLQCLQSLETRLGNIERVLMEKK